MVAALATLIGLAGGDRRSSWRPVSNVESVGSVDKTVGSGESAIVVSCTRS